MTNISMEKWVVRCTFCLIHWDCEDAVIAKRVIDKHNDGECGAFWMWSGPAIKAYRVVPGDDNFFPYGVSTEYSPIEKTKKYLSK